MFVAWLSRLALVSEAVTVPRHDTCAFLVPFSDSSPANAPLPNLASIECLIIIILCLNDDNI